MTTTDTPRTIIERELNEYIDENMKLWKIVDGQEGLMRKMQAEVERLKKMVMEAARKGDDLLEPYRLRAEKAETLLKQIHAFVEALNPTDK